MKRRTVSLVVISVGVLKGCPGVSPYCQVLVSQKLLLSDPLRPDLALLSVMELDHFGDILVEQLKQVENASVLELELLLRSDVLVKQLLPRKIDQDLDACVDEALQLVHDHFLLRPHLHVVARLLLMDGWAEGGLDVGVVEVLPVGEPSDDALRLVKALQWSPSDLEGISQLPGLVLEILGVLAGDAAEPSLRVDRLVDAPPGNHSLGPRILHQSLVEIDLLDVLLLDLRKDLPYLSLAELKNLGVVLKPGQDRQKQLKRDSGEDYVLSAHLRDDAEELHCDSGIELRMDRDGRKELKVGGVHAKLVRGRLQKACGVAFEEVLLLKVDGDLLKEGLAEDTEWDRRLGLKKLYEVVEHFLFEVRVQVLLDEDECHSL